MKQLPTFPDLPDHAMRVTLGGETFRYERKFRPRLNAWYISIYDVTGAPLILGRRLTTEALLLSTLPVDFPGVIFVRGPDRYLREDLGERVREIFTAPGELDPLEEEDDGFIVEFIIEDEA